MVSTVALCLLSRVYTHGRAVQVEPIKPTLKAPGTKRLKLQYDVLLSSFLFKFNLRHYTTPPSSCASWQGLVHSSTFQLNLSRFCHLLHPTYPTEVLV